MRFSLHFFLTAAITSSIWVRFIVIVVGLTLSIAAVAAVPDAARSTPGASIKPLTIAHLHLFGLHIRSLVYHYALTFFLGAVVVIFVRILRPRRWSKVVRGLIQLDVHLFFGLFFFLDRRLYDLTAPEREHLLVIVLIIAFLTFTRAEHFLGLGHRLWLFASVGISAIIVPIIFIRRWIVSDNSIVASGLRSVGAHAFRTKITVVVLVRATMIIAEIFPLLTLLLWFLHFWLYCCYNFIVIQTTFFIFTFIINKNKLI